MLQAIEALKAQSKQRQDEFEALKARSEQQQDLRDVKSGIQFETLTDQLKQHQKEIKALKFSETKARRHPNTDWDRFMY